ncbi:hypothetical protein L1987_54465 [Smallanthus sonchifolius]|uniref:Uncharacterized protein n=1 Tax=Smallanthus sonchifolius TaxID=185202 RepID=A0ACB9E7U9_9ASTR|nr:hypothetical protein L1987_54465 [Smallanthus sonchifolius]
MLFLSTSKNTNAHRVTRCYSANSWFESANPKAGAGAEARRAGERACDEALAVSAIAIDARITVRLAQTAANALANHH